MDLIRKKFILQICIFFCILAIPVFVQAQLNNMWDSITVAMRTKPVFTAGLDGKNTFVSGSGVPIRGFEIGLNFQNKISYTVGFYFLKSPIKSIATINQGTVNETTYHTATHVYYVSLIAEYTVFKRDKWSVYMPVQMGFGSASKDYYSGEHLVLSKQNTIFPLELAFKGNYRIWKFIGVSGGLGYRQAIGSNIIKDEDFNGITYSLGVKFWFRELCFFALPECNYCRYL